MPAKQRIKTKYIGVYYVNGQSTAGRKSERIYYIMYRRNRKLIEEKAGRQHQDAMTPAKAANIRSARIEGKERSNVEKRNEALKKRWDVASLKDEYFSQRPDGKSKKTDLGRYNNYLHRPFGNKAPKDIDHLSIDRLRVRLLKSKSHQTVKHIFSLLNRIIKFGTDRGLCTGTSFTIKLPKVDSVKTEDLTTEQLRQLIDVLNTTEHRTAANIMKLALFTGMRRGEIFKLQWQHIDFERGFIRIHEPKGGKSQEIPLNNNARLVLKNIRQSNEYVFPARGGGPRRDCNKDFNRIKTESGLPKDFRPMHGLRHVYATLLASSGVIDMLALQKLLTHKDGRMTQRYVHYHEEALKRAGNKTDDVFNSVLQTKNEEAVNE